MGAAPYRVAEYIVQTQKQITDAFRELVQSKHLYQNVRGPEAPTLEVMAEPDRGTVPYPDRYSAYDDLESKKELFGQAWIVVDPTAPSRATDEASVVAIKIRPPDVKLFCATCDRIEAFNLISAEDFLGRTERPYRSGGGTVQIFVLSFLCQSCKRIPEVFLVRRDGPRLTLSGRSPIEHVAVPSEIPKSVKHFYRGAVVAHQSGETLAGNFMLRTVIEQWVREATQRTEYADQVLDAYVQTLPDDFKKRFPVLRETYGDLSADIHSATGAVAAFEKARAEIVEHFEARRLFRL